MHDHGWQQLGPEGDVRPFQVSGDRPADDTRLRLQPRRPLPVGVRRQPQERPDRQPDVVPLRRLRPRLTPLHPAVLLQPPVVLLDVTVTVPPKVEVGRLGRPTIEPRSVYRAGRGFGFLSFFKRALLAHVRGSWCSSCSRRSSLASAQITR